MSTVLVTGGSGFIASHTILQLLGAGYQVRQRCEAFRARAMCARCFSVADQNRASG